MIILCLIGVLQVLPLLIFHGIYIKHVQNIMFTAGLMPSVVTWCFSSSIVSMHHSRQKSERMWCATSELGSLMVFCSSSPTNYLPQNLLKILVWSHLSVENKVKPFFFFVIPLCKQKTKCDPTFPHFGSCLEFTATSHLKCYNWTVVTFGVCVSVFNACCL